MTQSSFRDIEQLSALLDGNLNPPQAAKLEARLALDPELAAVYEDLRQARALLRRLPQRRAPRNFTLKPAAARVRPPLPRLFPTFRLASVLASLLLFFSLATNATLPRLENMASEAPMYAYGMGGAPESDRAMGGGGGDEPSVAAAPAVEEQAMMEAPAEEPAPAAEEPAAKTVEPTAAAQPDAEPTLEAAAALPPVEESQPIQEEPLPMPEPSMPAAIIPGWALVLLAVLAVASGATAFWLRWQTDRQWESKASPKK